jgi:hypothetical protein
VERRKYGIPGFKSELPRLDQDQPGVIAVGPARQLVYWPGRSRGMNAIRDRQQVSLNSCEIRERGIEILPGRDQGRTMFRKGSWRARG